MGLTCPIKRTVLTAAVAGLAVGTLGCQNLAKTASRRIAKPVARVGEARLVEQTNQGAIVQVMVEMDNYNDVPLPVITNRFTVTVKSRGRARTFSFADRPRKTLPARASQTLQLTAVFETGGQDLKGASYKVAGSVSYEPPGQIRRLLTESGVPLPKVDYSAKGRLR